MVLILTESGLTQWVKILAYQLLYYILTKNNIIK